MNRKISTHSRLVDPGKKGTLKSVFYGTERHQIEGDQRHSMYIHRSSKSYSKELILSLDRQWLKY